MALLLAGLSVSWPASDKDHARFHLTEKPQMIDALQFAHHSYCRSGLVVDVGANGGKEAMAAVHFGYDVLSVECLVREYSRLADIWKDEEKITLLSGCASNRLGLMTFHQADASSSLHAEAVSGGPEAAKFSQDGSKTSRALTFPLDQLIESTYADKRLCVVKIDTQGHELQVMEGMRASIERHRPVVIFEWDTRFGPFVNLTVPWIRSLAYDCAIPVPRKAPIGDCSVCNVLCMPDAKLWATPRGPKPDIRNAVRKSHGPGGARSGGAKKADKAKGRG